MSAIFDFVSLVTVLLLLICTCTYARELRPGIFDGGKVLEPGQRILERDGMNSFLWKLSRIGERLSPYIGISCVFMALHVLFIR